MPLTDVAIKKLKAADDKPTKVSDGMGLYLLVNPNGSKLWRMAYRFAGKQKTLALGAYPEVSLLQARKERDRARDLLRDDVDPSVDRVLRKKERHLASQNTFGVLVEEYLSKLEAEGRTEQTVSKNRWMLTTLAADLKDRPIADIKPAEILAVLKAVERSGRVESAHRLRGRIGAVYRYAIASLRAEWDPASSLKGALVRHVSEPQAAITDPVKFGRLLLAIDDYDGWPTLTACLKIQALCFQRPVETRTMEWAELDLDGAVWRLPAEKMKMRVDHEVPLSRQAIAVLNDIRQLTGRGRLVFPSLRSNTTPLSENAMNSALRRMGVTKTEHCAHGFRSSASTMLNNLNYDPELVELQLAHLDKNEVRRIYNRARKWDGRVKLMQDWADLCDRMKAHATITDHI